MGKSAREAKSKPLNRSLSATKRAKQDEFYTQYFAANFNKLGLKRLICTSYDGGYWGSPLAGQMTLFDEYNAGNGHRKKPKAIAVIVDHVKDESNDGAAGGTDVEPLDAENYRWR